MKQKYIHKILGTNARMTDLHAAIGLRQLDKFDFIIKRRSEIAGVYYSFFSSSKNIRLPKVRQNAKNAWFFTPILVDNRDEVVKGLDDAGIATRIAYPMPVYEQPFFYKYRDRNRDYDCPNAKWMTERVLNLPMFHNMTKGQLDYVAENVLKIIEGYA